MKCIIVSESLKVCDDAGKAIDTNHHIVTCIKIISSIQVHTNPSPRYLSHIAYHTILFYTVLLRDLTVHLFTRTDLTKYFLLISSHIREKYWGYSNLAFWTQDIIWRDVNSTILKLSFLLIFHSYSSYTHQKIFSFLGITLDRKYGNYEDTILKILSRDTLYQMKMLR